MYEEKDREQMNQDEREERKVNWTTPQKLDQLWSYAPTDNIF